MPSAGDHGGHHKHAGHRPCNFACVFEIKS
jgi:hypothetical protein